MDDESRALLDRMIDRFGLVGVKTAIVEICSVRAQRAAHEHQDAALAKVWASSADTFENVKIYQ